MFIIISFYFLSSILKGNVVKYVAVVRLKLYLASDISVFSDTLNIGTVTYISNYWSFYFVDSVSSF
jgi:hypothetical protein